MPLTTDSKHASPKDERRRHTRVSFNTAATLTQGLEICHAMVLDISLNGVLLELPEKFHIDATEIAYISIFLTDQDEIQMTVKLARSTNNFLGFQCEAIDCESMTLLRRLIELNTELPDASERILEELITSQK